MSSPSKVCTEPSSTHSSAFGWRTLPSKEKKKRSRPCFADSYNVLAFTPPSSLPCCGRTAKRSLAPLRFAQAELYDVERADQGRYCPRARKLTRSEHSPAGAAVARNVSQRSFFFYHRRKKGRRVLYKRSGSRFFFSKREPGMATIADRDQQPLHSFPSECCQHFSPNRCLERRNVSSCQGGQFFRAQDRKRLPIIFGEESHLRRVHRKSKDDA